MKAKKKQVKPKPAPDWIPAARKNGEGVRQTFLRIIARAGVEFIFYALLFRFSVVAPKKRTD